MRVLHFQTLSRFVLLLVLVVAPGIARALSIGVDVGLPSLSPVGSTKVVVTASGLGSGTAPSLGAFDLELDFDPTVISVDMVEFGDAVLGDQLDVFGLGALTGSGPASATAYNFFEVSLDDESDLDNLQASSFTLATLTIMAVGPGTSDLTLTVNSLADAGGMSIAPDSVGSDSVTVVPEPATASFLILGLAMLGAGRFRVLHRA